MFSPASNILVAALSNVGLPSAEEFTLIFDSENSQHLTGIKNIGGVRVVVDYEGGGGTVTNVSVGNLAPLFTTVVTNPGSTPSVAFTATIQAQNLVYASPDGAPGVPTFRSIVVADLPALPYWAFNGNTLGNDTTWIGSIDNFNYTIRTNSIERIEVLKSGEVGIGTGAGTVTANRQLNIVSVDLSVGNTALYLKGSNATGTEFGLIVADVTDQDNFHITNMGSVTARVGFSISTDILFVHGGFIGIAADNTFVGNEAGTTSVTTTTIRNTGIGQFSLNEITTGNENTGVGANSLRALQSGQDNTAVGYSALRNLITGDLNAAFGAQALLHTDGADENSGFGMNAGLTNSSGSRNTFIGSRSDSTLGTEVQSIALGAFAIITASNQLVIGSTQAPVTNAYIGQNVTTPDAKLWYGTANLSTIQTGNAGLVTGDLYVDSAANILANGDQVVGRKV